MSRTIIENLESWLRDNRAKLIADGVDTEFAAALNTDPPSARVDFESPEVAGRVTVWANGLCDLEMVSVGSGEQIMWEHRADLDAESVGRSLTQFVEGLSHKRLESK